MSSWSPAWLRVGGGPTLIAAGAVLTVAIFVVVAVPLVGFLVGLMALPLLADRLQPQLWSHTTRGAAIANAVVIALGLPAIAGLELALGRQDSLASAMAWLLIPLCGPVGIGAAVVPPVAAALFSAVGLVGSARVGRPWPWVLACLASPLVYGGVAQGFGPQLC